MDKRFLLRYYDKELGRYLTSDECLRMSANACRQCIELDDGIEGLDMLCDDPFIVTEQCLGILDKNKRLICESDILRMSNVRNMPEIEVVVKWKRGAWWLEFDDDSDDTMDSFVQEGAVFEVIGNIHEVE